MLLETIANRHGERWAVRLGWLLSVVSVALTGTASAQDSAAPSDNAQLYRTAEQLRIQADTLAAGFSADRALAFDKWRQAADLFRRSGAPNREAATLFHIGMAFQDDGRPDSAITYLRQAQHIQEEVGDSIALALSLQELGKNYRGILNQLDSSLSCYRRALAIARTIRDVAGEAVSRLGIGYDLGHKGQIDSAIVYEREALVLARAVADSTTQGAIDTELGAEFDVRGSVDSALNYDREALRILRSANDLPQASAMLSTIGRVLAGAGQLDSALAYYLEALPIARAVDWAAAAQAQNSIGLLYTDLGVPDSALIYFRAVLPIDRAMGNRAGIASAFVNIGRVLERTQQLDSARAYYGRALDLIREIGDHFGEAVTLTNLGSNFEAAGQPDSALANYVRALSLSRSVGDRPAQGWQLGLIGEAYAARHTPDSALHYYRAALAMQRRVSDRSGEAVTLRDLGMFYRTRGALAIAVKYFDSSAATVARLSRNAGNEFNQVNFNETTAGVYRAWTLTWLARARRLPTGVALQSPTIDSSSAAYAALAASERGRAQALMELMGEHPDARPGSDLATDGKLLAQRALGRASAVLVYSIAGDTLVTWLALPNGRIVVSEQPLPGVQIDTLIAALRYGVAHGNAAAKRGRGVTRASSNSLDPLDPRLLTRAVVDRAEAEGGVALRREAARIFLPASIRRHLPASGEILIVPDGGLGLVPFGLLPAADRDSAMLGDRFAIRYAPSLAAVAEAEARPGLDDHTDRARQLSPVLIVGNPTMPAPFTLGPEHYTLDSLPGAGREGRAVADSLGAADWLTGDRATETTVERLIPGARLVHLATHGLVYGSDAHARLSFVALAPDGNHDGHLSVARILDSLTFHAELVVLSACQTAVGNIKSAEGTLGLQRAVLAKGARSVLVSLWNVDDEATLFLVQRFYHHWLHDANEPSKGEALRMAEADVRAEAAHDASRSAWADPFYWAGFQLVGAR